MKETFRAWQPLTFGGVARYGHDWFGRIFVTGLVVAIFVTGSVVNTFRRTWVPVVDAAISHIPAGSEIRGGKFTTPRTATLAENEFLSISFNLQNHAPRAASEIELNFEPDHVIFTALTHFDFVRLNYPTHWTIDLDRAQTEPRWNAWRPAIYGYLVLGTILSLFASWISVGVIYAIPTRITAAILRKQLTLWGAFKMSVAALMPGAVLLTIGITIYGWGQLRLVELFVLWVIHFAVGWIFLAGAVFRLPKIGAKNPFLPNVEEEEDEVKAAPVRNPFQKKKA